MYKLKTSKLIILLVIIGIVSNIAIIAQEEFTTKQIEECNNLLDNLKQSDPKIKNEALMLWCKCFEKGYLTDLRCFWNEEPFCTILQDKTLTEDNKKKIVYILFSARQELIVKLLEHGKPSIRQAIIHYIEENFDQLGKYSLLSFLEKTISIIEKETVETWLKKISNNKAAYATFKEWWVKNKERYFKDAINQAIDRGLIFLKMQFTDKGDWVKSPSVYPPQWNIGCSLGIKALIIYTLLKCGIKLEEPIVSNGLQDILNNSFIDPDCNNRHRQTYTVSVIAMALAAALEKCPAVKNRNQKPWIDYQKKLKEAADWLILAQNSRGVTNTVKCIVKERDGYLKTITTTCGSWGYLIEDINYFDHSNTQFALLGLLAAKNVGINITIPDLGSGTISTPSKQSTVNNGGINIPDSVWQKALAHLESTQLKDGGWGYTFNKGRENSYNSMTAAGIMGIIICQASLQKRPNLNTIMKNDRIYQALKWLADNWRIEAGYTYYWLYTLERACMLGYLSKVGEHNWYQEGADWILMNQRLNGAWINDFSQMADTCFALLFLKRAYIPVITPSGQRLTPIVTPESNEEQTSITSTVETKVIIYLKNGATIEGELVSYDTQSYRVKFGNDIREIPWAQIEKIDFKSDQSESIPSTTEQKFKEVITPVTERINNDERVAITSNKPVLPITSTTNSGETISISIDKLASELMAYSYKEAIVVWVIDDSPSLENDRKVIAQKISDILAMLKNKMLLNMGVVGLGEKPILQCGISRNVEQIKKAIMEVGTKGSGVENCMEAIEYSIKMFKQSSLKKIFVVVTDEKGDDDARIERILKQLKENEITMFAIGGEATFSQTEGVDAQSGEIKNEYEFYISSGRESIDTEILDARLGPSSLYISSTEAYFIKSGFGPYALARLCAQTGGKYYFLSGPSYPEKVMRLYEPDLCSDKEYEVLNKKDSLRCIVNGILKELNGKTNNKWLNLPDRFFSRTEVEKAISKAKDMLNEFNNLIKNKGAVLDSALANIKLADTSRRWIANGELVLAQLYRGRYLLNQYIITLQEFIKKPDAFNPPLAKETETHYAEYYCIGENRAFGKNDDYYSQAKNALEKVIAHHPNIPWSTVAQKLKEDYLGGFEVRRILQEKKPNGERPKKR
jgi:hypothetical protein